MLIPFGHSNTILRSAAVLEFWPKLTQSFSVSWLLLNLGYEETESICWEQSSDLSETQIFLLKGNLVWFNYLTFLLQIFTAQLHHLPPLRCHRQIEIWNIEIFKDIQRYVSKASHCEKSESYLRLTPWSSAEKSSALLPIFQTSEEWLFRAFISSLNY